MDFYNTVRKMRTAQQEYFKTRTTTALRKAKDSEKEVDALLRAHYETNQSKLF